MPPKVRIMHPGLSFTSVALLALTLATTITAPTQKSSDNRLPEMQQILQKSAASDSKLIPHEPLLPHKTETLLSEAETMLTEMEQRRWLKDIVLRMKSLSSIMQQTPVKKSSITDQFQHADRNVSKVASTSTVPLQPTISGIKIPHPSLTDFHQANSNGSILSYTQNSTVPAANKPADQLTSKNLVTVLPEFNASLATSKLAKGQIESKDFEVEDELVKELESLRKSPVSSSRNVIEERVPTSIPEVRQGSLSKRMPNADTKLIVSRPQSTGYNVHNTSHHLHSNNGSGAMKKMVGKDARKYRIESRPVNKEVKNMNFNGVNTPFIASNIWKPFNGKPLHQHLNQMHSNDTFHVNRRNLRHMIVNRQKAHFHSPYFQRVHSEDIKSMINKLEKQHQNFLYMSHVPHNIRPQEWKQRPIIATRPQSHFMPPGNRLPLEPHLNTYHPENGAKFTRMSHPNNAKNGHKNSTVHTDTQTAFTSDSFPDHNIESEFSDEMKRQLRDGKVILLSDNVVSTHFDTDKKTEDVSLSKSDKGNLNNK